MLGNRKDIISYLNMQAKTLPIQFYRHTNSEILYVNMACTLFSANGANSF